MCAAHSEGSALATYDYFNIQVLIACVPCCFSWPTRLLRHRKWPADSVCFEGLLRHCTLKMGCCLQPGAQQQGVDASVWVVICMQAWPCKGAGDGGNQRWLKDAAGMLRPLHALELCLSFAGGAASPGAGLEVITHEL